LTGVGELRSLKLQQKYLLVPEDKLIEIVETVRLGWMDLGFDVSEAIESQITGESGNREFWVKITKNEKGI